MSEIRKIDESLAPILKDFETFIDYLQNNKVKLTFPVSRMVINLY